MRHWFNLAGAALLALWAQGSSATWFRVTGLALACLLFVVTAVIMVREEKRAVAEHRRGA